MPVRSWMGMRIEQAMRIARLIMLFLPVILLLFALAPPCAVPADSLTLADTIRIVLENNHELKSMKNSVLAQKAEIAIARSAFLPRITFEERASRTNNPPQAFMMKLNQERFSQSDFILDNLNNPGPVTDYQTAFFMEQPVFSMQSFWRLSQADSMFTAKNNDFLRKKEEIVFKVVETYLSLHTAKQYLNVSRAGVEDAREHLRIAEVRYRNDVGLYSDVLRAKTAVAEAEQIEVSADKNFNTARNWLGVLLATREAVDITSDDVSFPVKELNFYKQHSLNRRDMNALKARHEAAKKEVKAAEASYFPHIGIGGSYQINDHRNPFGQEADSWQVSAFLRWNIFDGFRRESERSKAHYQSAELNETLHNMDNIIAFAVQDAYLAIGETRKNVELAGSSLATAEEGKRLIESRYRNSLTPLIDLLDVQMNVNRARAALIARKNAYVLAIVRLMYESGTIMTELYVD